MIKKFSLKKISKYTILLLIALLFYLFPSKENYETYEEVSKNSNIIYNDIYLLDKNGYVSKTNISVNSKDKDKLIDELIEIMTINSKYQDKIPNGFSALLNEDANLISKKIEKNTVILNFNSDLLECKGDYEEKIIEAIIYTITSIDDIENVKIKINGEDLVKLPKSGKIIDSTLNRSFGINKMYDVTSIKNVTKVIIYYTNKTNNNNVYYIPVTKYTNSVDDKIKIIIDELTSKMSFESNLMSYLNYNAKLLDYSFNEGEFDLNFNEYLFDNSENKKVLEEVIYSISYSIMDNYDVTKVNFYVNNEKVFSN